jgi:hypothetical protein
MRIGHIIAALGLAMWIGAALWLAPAPAHAQGGCTELATNGGFEASGGWVLGSAPLVPQYVTYAKHSGDRSLALGITKGGNARSFSSARQGVTIPTAASKVTLSFWVYTMATGAPTTDYMELVILASDGKTVLDKPWYSRNDSRIWNQMTFDLSAWRGRTIQLYFNVYNDGAGGAAGMFLDDVSLIACPATTSTATAAPTATPTPTQPPTAAPTPTGTVAGTPTTTPTAGPTRTPTTAPTRTPTSAPTPSPTVSLPVGCEDLLKNGDFEGGIAWWVPGVDALPAAVVAAPVHGGAAALRLGSQDRNVESYSSARQFVTIPAGDRPIYLEFHVYTWTEATPGADRQEALLLAADGAPLVKVWSALTNERVWREYRTQVIGFAGQTAAVYFNAYNDGLAGKTALFVDDVHLWSCPLAALPTATATGLAARAALAGTTFTPEVTRMALLLTPLPTATVAALRWPEATSTPDSAAVAGAAPRNQLLSRILDTWRERWWVVVVVIVVGLFMVILLPQVVRGGP